MAIEKFDNTGDGIQLPIKTQDVFAPDKTVNAGFKVKHPLFDVDLLLIGFTPQCPSDRENAQVIGLVWINAKTGDNIYPKVTFDMMKNSGKMFTTRCSENSRWNYYLYKLITDEEPMVWTDSPIYAVCKYREDGIIRHDFFNLHELTLTTK